MFALTRQEKMLVTLVLLSLLIGSVVKHYRQIYREHHPAPLATPAARKNSTRSD